MTTHFTPEWKKWIKTNIEAGNDPDGMFKILLDEGYDHNLIIKEMNYQPSTSLSELVNPLNEMSHQIQAQREPTINNNGLGISREHFIRKATALDSNAIDLRIIKNFLNQRECYKIIKRIKSRLRPSEVSNSNVNSCTRNSRTCDLGRLEDEFIEKIDIRICKLMGIHRAYSEVLEGQYYEVGQEFKAHTDYFDKREFVSNCQEFGQRTFTVMIYLNEVEKGGETCFTHVGQSFKPHTGTAVIWNNLNPDGSPNINTLHKSRPVQKGYKAIITKWFRSRPANGYEYLNMFTKDVNRF